MTAPDFTKLPYGFPEFPRATLAWNAAVGRTEPWLSPEGIAHRIVHTAADANVPHANGLPGIAPFLGGPYATMFAQKPWTSQSKARYCNTRRSRRRHCDHVAAAPALPRGADSRGSRRD